MSHEIVDEDTIGVYARHGKIGIVVFQSHRTASTELERDEAKSSHPDHHPGGQAQ